MDTRMNLPVPFSGNLKVEASRAWGRSTQHSLAKAARSKPNLTHPPTYLQECLLHIVSETGHFPCAAHLDACQRETVIVIVTWKE